MDNKTGGKVQYSKMCRRAGFHWNVSDSSKSSSVTSVTAAWRLKTRTVHVWCMALRYRCKLEQGAGFRRGLISLFPFPLPYSHMPCNVPLYSGSESAARARVAEAAMLRLRRLALAATLVYSLYRCAISHQGRGESILLLASSRPLKIAFAVLRADSITTYSTEASEGNDVQMVLVRYHCTTVS